MINFWATSIKRMENLLMMLSFYLFPEKSLRIIFPFEAPHPVNISKKKLKNISQENIFPCFSTCWNPWLIPDSGWKWWLAYRDAMSFRASHYFVSFISEASAITAGFGASKVKYVLGLNKYFKKSHTNLKRNVNLISITPTRKENFGELFM